jgi:hypothetical protein
LNLSINFEMLGASWSLESLFQAKKKKG